MVLGDFTFLDVFWSMLVFTGLVLFIWMFIACFADVFSRRDVSGWGKAGWVIFFIIFPFFGCLTYIIVRPTPAGP